MYQIVRNNIKNLTFENACIEVHRITMKMFVYLFKCLFTCWWATISTNILWRVRYNAACAALVVKYRFWRLSWSGNPAHSLLSYSHHPLSSSHLVRNELIHTNILRYVNRSKRAIFIQTIVRDSDPDPQVPHVFGPPGSGIESISQRYGSGSIPFPK